MIERAAQRDSLVFFVIMVLSQEFSVVITIASFVITTARRCLSRKTLLTCRFHTRRFADLVVYEIYTTGLMT
jgi:hypothetical protein